MANYREARLVDADELSKDKDLTSGSKPRAAGLSLQLAGFGRVSYGGFKLGRRLKIRRMAGREWFSPMAA